MSEVPDDDEGRSYEDATQQVSISCYHLMENLRLLVRAWQNDQTLFVKNLNFDVLTVFLLVKQF